MTVIENYSPKVQYQGPVAIDDLLPISFPYNDTEDVKCLLNQTELVFNEDYTVTGQGLIFKITATEEDTITIYRSTPLDQQAEFPQNNRFNSAKLNASLDKICMQQQEQNEKITRSVKVPIDTNVSFEGSLPTPIPNRILRINEAASGFEFVPYDLDERLDTFEDTVVDNITAGQEAIENSFEEFKNETNITINNIDTKTTNAVNTANTANTKSDEAIDIANTASATATNAVNTSNSAVISADTAVATANSADIKSDEALLISQEAKEASLIAEENATTAKEKVDIFEQDIETVLEAADQIAQLEGAVDTAVQASEAATRAAEDATQAAEDAIASLDSKLDIDGTAVKATADADGNIITETYRAIVDSYNKDDVDTLLNNKADKDLSNLTEQGEKHFLNKSQITNCLLEVPQRIKLELNNGVLTLKAGSEVIVPNGFEEDGVTPKFDYVTIESDRDIPNRSTTAGQRMYWVTLPNGYENGITQYCYSGNTSAMNSTTPNNFSTFYNTETNKMYRGNGTIWEEKPYSLPVCLATNDTTNAVTSIDQIFNGFGYTGSTIWVDRDVNGLIANGRNEDETLNNIEFITNAVHTHTFTVGDSYSNRPYWITSSGEFGGANVNINYHGDINKVLYDVNNTSRLYCDIGRYTVENGQITSFQPKLPFRAVEYNDLNTKVNKAGDTMTDTLSIQFPTNYDYTSTTAPSSTEILAGSFTINDKNGYPVAALQNAYNQYNNVVTRLMAIRNVSGVNKTAAISVYVGADGAAKFDFPKCTTKATTSSTAHNGNVAVVTQNYVNGTSWYRVWSDGWIEQGGYFSGANNGSVTLLKAFSNTNYTVTMATHNATVYMQGNCLYKTAGNFTLGYTGGANGTASGTFWYACGY